MLTIISQFWLDLLVLITAGSTIFIGWVSMKKFQPQPLSSHDLTSGIDDHLNITPPCLTDPIIYHTSFNGTTQMIIKVKNTGRRLWYQGLSILCDNEILVKSEISRLGVAQGEELTFELRGDRLEQVPFHFRVIYSDDYGNTYSQGISGVGEVTATLESPLNLQV